MKIFSILAAATLAATGISALNTEDPDRNTRSRAILPDSEDISAAENEIPGSYSETMQIFDSEEAKPARAVYAATTREIECLMSAVFHEARGEPLEGKIAVVEVVLARRDSGRFSANACGVVAQQGQFSFVRGGHVPQLATQHRSGYRDLVMKVLAGEYRSKAKGSTYFHAAHVKPSWRHKLKHVSQIGRHLFYRT